MASTTMLPSDEQELIQLLQSTTLLNVARRPDKGGTQGRPIPLLLNAYTMKVKTPEANVVLQWDVSIEPILAEGQEPPTKVRALPPLLRHEIFEHGLREAARQGQHGLTAKMVDGIAFDGTKNAFTPMSLPSEVLDLEVSLPPKQALPPISGTPGAAARGPPPARRGDSDRRFHLYMKQTRKIDLHRLLEYCTGDRQIAMASTNANVLGEVFDGLQALDVLLANEPIKKFKVQGAGRHRYFDGNNTVPIYGGAEIWRGLFQSVRPVQQNLVVVVHTAFSAFLGGGDLLTVAAKVLNLMPSGGGGGGGGGFRGGGRGGRGGGFRGGPRGGGPPGRGYGDEGQGGGPSPSIGNLQPFQLQELRKRLKGSQIRVTHRPTNRVELFKGFTPRSALQMEFDDRDGIKQTIVSYFKKKFNYTVKYPNLPCVILGDGRSYVPMEVCAIVPGSVSLPPMRLNPMQVQDMIRECAQKPDDKRRRIEEIRLQLGYENEKRIKQWGVEISPRLLAAPGRLLTPPEPLYSQGGQRPRVQNGSWNFVNARFVDGGQQLVAWSVVNFSNKPAGQVQSLVGALMHTLRGLGVRVVQDRPPYFEQGSTDPAHIQNTLLEAGKAAYKQGKELTGTKVPAVLPQLFFCVMDRVDAPFYDQIKRVSAMLLNSPVASQVVNTKKAFQERGQPQYLANVAMKVAIKLGGTTHTVGDRDLPGLGPQTMLIGADVTHPGPGMDLPSIAGSVATVDGKRSRYSSEIRAQLNPRARRAGQAQEVLMHAESMFKGHLKRWFDRNKRLPTSVVVFRDGVSEGQYQSVLDNEVFAVKAAARQIQPNADLKVTYVICGKRHNVRLFAQDGRDTDGRSGNLPAGVVCDQNITSPYAFDFYLQSQAGLVGTTIPAHYVVLLDENKFSSDNMQRTINSLCYSYARATRSVSLVPPAYYADQLCAKAKALVWPEISDISTQMSGEGRPEQGTEVESELVMDKLRRNNVFNEVMWFM